MEIGGSPEGGIMSLAATWGDFVVSSAGWMEVQPLQGQV
jgi:hypothetical protein